MIVLIPARSGSKGLPGKNKKLLCGKPLIQHSIYQALETEEVTEVYVSTDDHEIIDQVNNIEGASAPFIRPPDLSNDSAASIDVYLHFAQWWEEENGKPLTDLMVLLPTSPLRVPLDISNAINVYKEGKAEVVLSFKETKPIAWHRYIDEDGKISEILPIDAKDSIKNRQEISEKPFVLNGSIYIFHLPTLMSSRSFFGDKTLPYIMPACRSIDIDSQEDFDMAEAILKNRK